MVKVNRIFRLTLMVGALLTWCVAASAQDIKFNYMPGTDFSKYRTYKWVQIPNVQYPNSIMDDQIKRAIDAQLATERTHED
jgi:hypothetical protein